jgi:ferredoxin
MNLFQAGEARDWQKTHSFFAAIQMQINSGGKMQLNGFQVNRLPQTVDINHRLCHACGACVGACPSNALVLEHGAHLRVQAAACTGCGICAQVCPVGALALVSAAPQAAL